MTSSKNSIGILGAGQLGRMLAMSAHNLGLEVRLYDPSLDACAATVAAVTCANWDDKMALQEFAKSVDVVSLEFENVPVNALNIIAKHKSVLPNAAVLEIAQDRLNEKTLFLQLNIPTTKFVAVNSVEELQNAAQVLGLPAVLKTRRMGYDGKGQLVIRNLEDLKTAWETLGKNNFGLMLEEFIPFERELSLVAVRGANNETRFYPLTENLHHHGILQLSVAPAENSANLQTLAEHYCHKIFAQLNYVGVLAIEFFERDNQLVANEIAPRVHNSGHWTQDGAVTSQFENHIRAVTGLPLGSTDTIGFSAMLNFIGTVPAPEKILSIPTAKLHLYGKAERAGRKLGHVNIVAKNKKELQEKIAEVQTLVQI